MSLIGWAMVGDDPVGAGKHEQVAYHAYERKSGGLTPVRWTAHRGEDDGAQDHACADHAGDRGRIHA